MTKEPVSALRSRRSTADASAWPPARSAVAQAALDLAVQYAHDRQPVRTPHRRLPGSVVPARRHGHSGRRWPLALPQPLLASATAVKPFGVDAAMAKLFATDMAMQVTTDAVQVLGGAGYVKDYPAERYFREAKALQIVEGTNQIQRVVIGRSLRPSQIAKRPAPSQRGAPVEWPSWMSWTDTTARSCICSAPTDA